MTSEDRMWTSADLLLMWQVGRDFEAARSRDAWVAGWRAHDQLVTWAIREALSKPSRHGGVDLDQAVRNAALDLYRRYLGVGTS